MTPCVYFITGNANKLREVKAILQPEIEVRSHAIDLEEIQGSIEDVTTFKCQRAAEIVDGPVLVEDTALCFSALGGLPGPYIKWFLSTLGHDGLNNIISAYSDKSADAVCTFAFSKGRGQAPILFQGRCHGLIVPARGPSHFGWDPVFEHNGQTFAEMTAEEKNKISHRANALCKLREWFNANADQL